MSEDAGMQYTSDLAGLQRADDKPPTVDDDAQALSLLYTLLPRILQKRVPRLPSLRSAARSYTCANGGRRASDVASPSPPPSYHTRSPSPALSAAPCLDGEEDESDREDGDGAVVEEPDILASASMGQRAASGSALSDPARHTSPLEAQDRSAQYGLTLLQFAAQEPLATPLSRRLYVDGLSYALRGLPRSLTVEEEVVLRTALPQQLLGCESSRRYTAGHDGDEKDAQTSILHRTTATLTQNVLLLLLFLIPYIQTLSTHLWTLERQYKVSERFYAQSVLLSRMLGFQTLAVISWVWAWRGGVVREVIVSGLKDLRGGFGEALQRLGEEGRLRRGREGSRR